MSSALCSRCDAVCCRLTVTLGPEDSVPDEFRTFTHDHVAVMKRGSDGWCSALDHTTHGCSIYEQRPSDCRRFTMAGPYCLVLRHDYGDRIRRGIPLALHGAPSA